ncbi:hypothetical protein BDV93DRAFT_521842 [Ceratobasidium sp. AG-I]|nr:hypothetical protein BDV93DRAFT_521842 [Ceratobasidium sp. AG-I]
MDLTLRLGQPQLQLSPYFLLPHSPRCTEIQQNMDHTNDTEDLSLVQTVDPEGQDAPVPPESTSAMADAPMEVQAPAPMPAEAPIQVPVPIAPIVAPPATEAAPPHEPEPSLFKSFLGPPGLR